jgi:hypothetical protein
MKTQSSFTRLRKTPRAFVEHVVLLNSKTAMLTDLSLSGIRVQGVEAIGHLKPNDTAQLTWKLLPEMKSIELDVKCIWRSSDAVGFSFKNLDAKTRCLIRALVRYHRNSES